MEPLMVRLDRRFVCLAAALALPLLAAAPAGAQQVADGSAGDLDPALARAITKLATRGFAAPAEAQLRSIHLSKARNGRGYCGEVSVGSSAEFVPFHAIIEADGSASLLRLSDAATPEDKETAIRLLTNFGCLE
jgi:hypothetical protein